MFNLTKIFIFQIFKFCRSNCHKNFNKKKNPRNAKWTIAFRKSAGKELAVDPSFEFEKRRNAPVKYNRELWQQTSTLYFLLIFSSTHTLFFSWNLILNTKCRPKFCRIFIRKRENVSLALLF